MTAPAVAAVIDVNVVDSTGRAASDAVVTLEPVSLAHPISHAPERATIDQRHETFLPLVVVVRKGGSVVFTNNDVTKHQVYSFSPVKQFEFVIAQGQTSAPVEFDQTGIAAIGCNIHDQMIAYAFVTDDTFAGVSDGSGHAKLGEVPEGRYRVSIWHPQIRNMETESGGTLDVQGPAVAFTAKLSIALTNAKPMKPMHMDY